MTSSPPIPALDCDSERLARDYEELSTTRQLEGGRQLAAALCIAPGKRVLDVGCGTGLVTEHVADLVGPSGYVLGINPLPARIELARAKARPNLASEVGDARDLSVIADSSFDVVFLNAAFHRLPEKTGPLRAFARVLWRGGRLGITITPKDEDNTLYRTLFDTFQRTAPDRHPRTRAWSSPEFETQARRSKIRELCSINPA